MQESLKKKYFKPLLIISVLCCVIISCDHGIEPEPLGTSGFSGTVHFVTEWPDSVKRSFLVVFKDPLLSDSNFVITNLRYLSREIPLGVQSHDFNSLDSAYIPQTPGPFPSGTYSYVAVVQQSTELLSFDRRDWFVSGIYYTFGDTTKPGTLVIPDSTFVENINIWVDFNNPPPQPLGGN